MITILQESLKNSLNVERTDHADNSLTRSSLSTIFKPEKCTKLFVLSDCGFLIPVWVSKQDCVKQLNLQLVYCFLMVHFSQLQSQCSHNSNMVNAAIRSGIAFHLLDRTANMFKSEIKTVLFLRYFNS